jgi:predicted membrane chloride channel (bestrophin family)
LWQAGRELITQFVTDLARQQEERERRVHLAQHNQRQFARRQSAQKQLDAAQALHEQASAQVAALETERAALTRFWHYFKRRALGGRIHAAQAQLGEARAALAQAQAAAEEIARESLPEFPGLSLQARRAINIAAIAYAEVLCLRVATLKAPLVARAHEATSQREVTDSYGPPQECVLLMGQITRAHSLIAAREGLAEEIRERGERLKRVARYRGANDGSPLTDSIALTEGDILQLAPLGAGAERLPNVLADDTWDLFRILLR